MIQFNQKNIMSNNRINSAQNHLNFCSKFYNGNSLPEKFKMLTSRRSTLSSRSQGQVGSKSGSITLPHVKGNNILPKSKERSFGEENGTNAASNLSLMHKIKDNINLFKDLITKLIKDNSSTPDIGSTLTPLMEQLSNTFDVFFRSAVKYFIQHQKIQLSAKANQILSSSFCRGPIQNFKADWERTSSEVDQLINNKSPPHSREISTKFKAIESALDTINTANEARKNPNSNLTRCINSMYSLNERLSDSIVNLFAQPSFPHFETDLLTAFKLDIKVYKKVLSDAFANEFLQAGVPTPVLVRIKSNIFSDCMVITENLKGAFEFPNKIKEIYELKSMLNILLNAAIQRLSVPFLVIFPTDPNNKHIDSTQQPSHEELAAQENPELESKNVNHFVEATMKTKDFVKNAYSILRIEKEVSSDPFHDLPTIQDSIIDATKKIESLKNKIEKQSILMKEDIVVHREKSAITSQCLLELNSAIKDKDKMIEQLNNENKVLHDNLKDLKDQLVNASTKISELEASKDLDIFRENIRDAINVLNVEKTEFSILSDTELIDAFKCVLKKVQSVMDVKDASLKEMDFYKGELVKLKSFFNLKTNELSDVSSGIIAKNTEFNEKINTYDEKFRSIHRNLSAFAEVYCTKEEVDLLDICDLCETLKLKVDEVINKHIQESNVQKQTNEAFFKDIKSFEKKLSEITNICKQDGEKDESLMDNFERRKRISDLIELHIGALRSTIDELNRKNVETGNLLIHYKKKYEDEISSISKQIGIDYSDSEEMVQLILNSIGSIKDPLLEKISFLENELKEAEIFGSFCLSRFSAIAKCESKPTNVGSTSNLMETIKIISDKVQDSLEMTHKKTAELEKENVLLRSTLEKLDIELAQFGKEEPLKNVMTVSSDILCQRVTRFVSQVTSEYFQDMYIDTKTIDQILGEYLDEFKTANVQNARGYLPLFVLQYSKYIKSINSLDPIFHLVESCMSLAEAGQYASFNNYLQKLKISVQELSPKIQIPQLLTLLFRLICLTDFFYLKFTCER